MLAPFAEKMEKASDVPLRAVAPLNQSVQEVMRAEVTTVSPDTPALEIVNLLLQKGYHSLPVIAENGRLLGIITDGDLLRRAGLSTRLDGAAALSAADWQQKLSGLSSQAVTAASLMTAPVITITPTAPLSQAVQQMAAHHLKRLPVVNEQGRLAGWVSRVDILRALERRQPSGADRLETMPAEPEPVGTVIADLMYQDVPIVSPQATLEEILQVLERDRRRRAVVVDSDRRVVGIISDGDLLRRTTQAAHASLLARLRGLVTGQPAAGAAAALAATALAATETAAELMTTPVITIGVDDTPATALHLMMQHQIKRLPVVDQTGRLVGLLGRDSLLRGLLSMEGAGGMEASK